MSPVQKPQSKKSGGKHKASASTPTDENKSSNPLENLPPEFSVIRGGKTLVVHDEKGQILSVTRVSADSPYRVGVKPGPGQTVKEYEAEDLHDALEPSGAAPEDPKTKRGKRG
jgi:hypothetical protein